MPRFYCPQLSEPAPATVELDEQESHHARRVLRLEVGDQVDLFDGQGRTAIGRLIRWSGQRPALAVLAIERVETTPPPRPSIDIAAAIPKGAHADQMIAALSQLGVGTLIPLRTSRSVVDPRPGKLDRFSRAAIESAKQCGRAYIMNVAPPATLPEVLAMGHDLRLVAAPGSDVELRPGAPGANCQSASGSDTSAIRNPARLSSPKSQFDISSAARALILIGPEGGWSDDELGAASAAGCVRWSLGPHILRIETAATAAAAVAAYLAWER